jgi:hypothetical protein
MRLIIMLLPHCPRADAPAHTTIAYSRSLVSIFLNMNQTFNIHRFTLMLRLDWADKGKNYLLMACVLISCLLILMVPVALSDEYGNFREVLHYFALIMILLLGGSLYTSNALLAIFCSRTRV